MKQHDCVSKEATSPRGDTMCSPLSGGGPPRHLDALNTYGILPIDSPKGTPCIMYRRTKSNAFRISEDGALAEAPRTPRGSLFWLGEAPGWGAMITILRTPPTDPARLQYRGLFSRSFLSRGCVPESRGDRTHTGVFIFCLLRMPGLVLDPLSAEPSRNRLDSTG